MLIPPGNERERIELDESIALVVSQRTDGKLSLGFDAPDEILRLYEEMWGGEGINPEWGSEPGWE